jgi:hypothetical protein
MKRTLSEEVERMHKIMGLEEQKWLDKVKTADKNVGNKIRLEKFGFIWVLIISFLISRF